MSLSSFFARHTRQTATYWAPQSMDEFGDPTFAGPVTLSKDGGDGVRWENIMELYINADGREARSRSVIWSTTPMAVGGYLYLGESSAANPESLSTADQIKAVYAVPNIKNSVTLYKVIL